MASVDNPLGQFLRARREQLSPESAGFPADRKRRVKGLRREEVAILASISPDYYLRLEQGRDRRPSAKVLESLAAALQLDEVAASHLQTLAATVARYPAHLGAEDCPPRIHGLVASVTVPAYVLDRCFDILAANPAARALSPRMVKGENRLRAMFLDEDERRLHLDWEDTTKRIVGTFRRAVGADVHDPYVSDLIDELTARSDRFRELWACHHLYELFAEREVFAHPVVGEMQLHREKLAVDDGAGSLIMVIYHPAPDSPDAEKMQRLIAAAETGG